MSTFTDLTETTISRKEQYSGPLFTVHSDVVRLPNGNTSVREVVEHVDGVAVLPLDERNNVLTAAQNRKAFHDYFVEDKYEAGIELFGTEVKSVRAGTLNLKDAYCTVKDGELFVQGMHISPYEKGNIFNKDPVRTRRLLMHKREIRKLHALIKQDGYTLVPLSVYFKDARVKLEVGLCKGKKNYDKREASAKRDAKREIDRTMKERNR